ncbi:MFS general substrate transporter [Athelia psychrophila]|uniref:MFS general substrate transporter n=1 Tax=Athelia psychrophila TaxID=1759441 RepID=A0A166W559_9AGAM|nr:MFS general substrate transporter [Fibularhizoctonia sp. CBS 109695]
MPQIKELDQSPSQLIEHGDAGTYEGAEKQPSLPRAIAIIATCTMAMVVDISNSTMVSIALPVIGRDLDIPEYRLQWLVSAYALSSACFLVFFGRLADLFGPKRVFIAGSLFMTAFSLGLSFVNDEITLDVLRGFQGIGAAATIPSSIGILATAFPPSRMRSFAFATFTAGAPVGAAIGMTLGGVLTQLTIQTWRSVFYLSTGLSAATLLLGLFSIHADLPPAETDRRIDWLGALLVTTGLILIMFVLSEAEIVGWKTPYIIALLIVGVICVASFILWEQHLETVHKTHPDKALKSKWTPPPLMKLSIWGRAKGSFAAIMCIALFNWSCFDAWAFWAQLYYQDYLNLTPILTMVRLLPMFVTGLLCNFAIALLIGRLSLVHIVVMGTMLTGTASLLFALIDPSSPYWAFGFPAAVVSVIGADFVYASGTIFVANISLPHEQSLAGALFGTMVQIGTGFGLTISTIVFNRVVARHEDFDKPPLDGYKAAQWTAFGFAILSSVLAAVFLRGVGIVGHSEKSGGGDERHEQDKEQGVAAPSIDATSTNYVNKQ